MYIPRSEIPSHIYAKHQYRKESEFRNMWCIIHSNIWVQLQSYNYKVTTGCDTILHKYYITDRRKCENTKRYTSMNSTKGVHELQKKNPRGEQGACRIGLWTVYRWSKLPRRISDQQLEESTRFKFWDLDMRIQESQNSPTSGDSNAKWRAKINTHVSINPNHKHALKTVSWAHACKSK